MGVKRKWGITANGYGVSLGDDENVLKLTVVMIKPQRTYSKPLNSTL